MADTFYRTIDGDMMDLLAFKQYGLSSLTTEVLLDVNYRIADNPIRMPSGIVVDLPPQRPPPEASIIKLWN